jgi:hypothetical protein
MSKIRSPMRNPDLAKATDLRPLYLSSFNRVTEYAPWHAAVHICISKSVVARMGRLQKAVDEDDCLNWRTSRS